MTTNNQRRTPRRRSVWVGAIVNNEALAAGGTDTVLIDGQRNVDNADGLTVVRTIFDLAFASTVAGGRGRLSAGIVLVNQDVSSTFPDPDATPEDGDWIWVACNVYHEWNNGTGQWFHHLTGDLRSQRKYGQGDVLRLILKNLDATNPIDTMGYVRCLILLP